MRGQLLPSDYVIRSSHPPPVLFFRLLGLLRSVRLVQYRNVTGDMPPEGADETIQQALPPYSTDPVVMQRAATAIGTASTDGGL